MFNGIIQDTLFNSNDTLTLEVLETGQLDTLTFAESFQLILPLDTLWNICVNNGTKERCYEIVHLTQDTVFTQSIPFDTSSVLSFDEKAEDVSLVAQVADSLLNNIEVIEEEKVEKIVNKKTRLQPVVIRLRKKPQRALGQSTVSAKNIKRMPSLAEADVIKAIQALPGVVASSDFSSKLYVRGAGSDQNLFLFDNGVVFSPIHFFGLFSTFLVEGIDKVDFYKGGFSPQYGNRLSSVVDVQSRKGGNDSTNAIFEKSSVRISTFASQLHTEGRTDHWRWLFAGRATYIKEVLDATRKLGMHDLQLDYRFYDLQGNIAYDPSEDESWMFSFYQGQDNLDLILFQIKWGNATFPINYYKKLNDDWSFRGSLALSLFSQEFGLAEIQSFENEANAVLGKAKFTRKISKDNELDMGFAFRRLDMIFAQHAEINDFYQFDQEIFYLLSPFVEDKWTMGDLNLKLGARFTWLSNKNEYYVEPRLSSRYNLDQDQYVDFHVGYYYQFINSIQFVNQETINEFYYPVKKTRSGNELKPSSSLLLSTGYSWNRIAKEYDFLAEAYFKTINNLYVFDFYESEDVAEDYELGDYITLGEGYSYGFETSIRKNDGKIFGGMSYSYGYSIARDKADKDPYPANWDQTHSFKGDLGVNWKGKNGIWPHKKKGRYWNSSFLLKLSSGLPYTEATGFYKTNLIDQSNGDLPGGPNPGFDNNVEVAYGCHNCGRYPYYLRVDLKLWDIGREGKWKFAFTIINILDSKNIWFYVYDNETNPPERIEIPQLPRLPILLNYEYYF